MPEFCYISPNFRGLKVCATRHIGREKKHSYGVWASNFVDGYVYQIFILKSFFFFLFFLAYRCAMMGKSISHKLEEFNGHT